MYGAEGNQFRFLDPLIDLLRMSFNITLGLTGLFAISGTGAMNFVALCSLAAVWSFGVGGNLPVDSAIFLGT